MKRFTKLLYILIVFSMLLMPYTTVYAEDASGGNMADGTAIPTGVMAGPSAEGAYLGGVDPSDQRDVMMRLEIPYYNAKMCAEGSKPSEGESAGTVSGKDNEEKVFNFLRTATFNGHKLNAAQIAGIMANLSHESGFDPNKVNPDPKSHASGIAQWVGNRWKPELAGNLAKQLEYLKWDIEKSNGAGLVGRGFYNLANTAGDAGEAAVQFCEVFERPGTNPEEIRKNCAPRRNMANPFYSKYSSKVGGPAPSDGAGYGPDSYVWVGDSRTVAMKTAVGKDGANDRWVAEEKANYKWFNSDGVSGVTSKLKPGEIIVFNMGVNDLNDAQQYIDRLKELAKGDWKDHKIIISAVTPVDDKKSARAKNAAIKEFNDKLRNALSGIPNISFTDASSQISSNLKTGKEGVHYTDDEYKKIYNAVKNDVNDTNSSVDSKAADNCEPESPDDANSGPTKYAKDGAVIYDQNDKRWASKPFGKYTIGDHNGQNGTGCGPSAMAMIITALTHKNVTPDQVAAVGGSAPEGGASWTLPDTIAKSGKWPIQVEKISHDKIDDTLTKGGMVWMCGKNVAPLFSKDGHCIGIRGRTNSNKWLIFDSGYTENSNKEWDKSIIYQGLKNNRGDGSVWAVYPK